MDGNPDLTKWVLCQKAGSELERRNVRKLTRALRKKETADLYSKPKNGDEYKAGGIETQGKF